MLAAWLQEQWYSRRRLPPALCLAWPVLGLLTALYVVIAGARRRLLRGRRLPVPVIVVGNITVGGAGKTPLTLWLARQLRARGRQPGIVSRGHGRRGGDVCAVTSGSAAVDVGDEPLLLARRSGVPVWVGRDRAAAAEALLARHPEVDVILCDDGLQHYRLARDIELAVFDGRGIGNGWRLPLGPLRESPARLHEVDAIIRNGGGDLSLPPGKPVFDMHLQPGEFYALGDPTRRCRAGDLWGRALHAVAGIGDPERFFRTLKALGLNFVAHPFPDHHAYTAEDLAIVPGSVLLMTEKDAVKCAHLTTGEAWVLPVEAELSPALTDLVMEKLRGRQAA